MKISFCSLRPSPFIYKHASRVWKKNGRHINIHAGQILERKIDKQRIFCLLFVRIICVCIALLHEENRVDLDYGRT